MRGWAFGLFLLGSMIAVESAAADPQWIWLDAGQPEVSAPSGKVWFRREFRIDQPSTAQIRLIADDTFTLWVNGRRFAPNKTGPVHRYNLNGIVSEGQNVIGIEVENKAGKAGLWIDGILRDQGGGERPLDSDGQWLATQSAPINEDWLASGFDAADWKPVKLLGLHADSPWKEIDISESYLDRYSLAEGLRLERVAEPEVSGSVVAMTWGNRGRLIVSRERGPIVSLIDADQDGKYDSSVEFSDQITNCQGLLVVGTDLYAVGEGPDGTGLYRLADENQDDKADAIEQLQRHRGGMGEHGPHAVVLGPDGGLYHCVGNHAGVRSTPQPTSPYRKEIEGYLLNPKFEDGRGHARGIQAPGGTIWRFSPDGQRWWHEVGGFRNEYDIAFNADGELFTFDSDMEWDIGEPWYRPVRVNHCTGGAEFGWRSGAAKWPDYYFDSLPATSDIGRGSPTGVVMYEHRQWPEKYHGSLLICDWSMGRIIAVMLDPAGASYDGSRTETVVTGNPLNVSDIEVAPDGSVVFSTGGRGTEGGIYRVVSEESAATAASATTVEELITLPQFSSAWAREQARAVKESRGDAWANELAAVLSTGDANAKIRALTILAQIGPAPTLTQILTAATDASPAVRAFAAGLLNDQPDSAQAATLTQLLADDDLRVRRRACEAFIRTGLEPPVEPLLVMLGSDDRFLRFAARLALERVPAEKWKNAVLESSSDRVVLHGMLGLSRLGASAITPQEILDRLVEIYLRGTKEKIEALRLAQLAILGGAEGDSARKLGERLLADYPTGNLAIDRESSRLMARLQVEGAADKLVAALESATNQQDQVHLALVVGYLETGWTTDLKRRVVRWYETSQKLSGGHSFEPYLENIVSKGFPRLSPDERRDLLAGWKEYPYASRLLLRRNEPKDITEFASLAEQLLAESRSAEGVAFAGDVNNLTIDALGRCDDPKCREILFRLFEENPDRRDLLASKISEKPVAESRPYLVRSLSFVSDNTLQFVLRGLERIGGKAEKPEEIRQAIIAGLKLGDRGGKVAVNLLRKWTGVKPASDDIAQALASYQQWFAENYPAEPPATLPVVDKAESKYTADEILNYLNNDPRGQNGDVARGKEMYTKTQCIKCHKFGSEGQGIGPDLTTLRKRFQKKEILEAILHPSQIISDQYRTVTIVTVDGLVQSGMLAAQQGQDKVVLWLNNGERLEIDAEDVDEQQPSTTSLMPPGLLKDATLEDIADLFAFLETSKSNSEPAGTAPQGIGGGQ